MVMPPAVLVYAAAAVVAMRRENESITSRKEGGSNGTVRRTEGEVWEKEAESRDACARTYLRTRGIHLLAPISGWSSLSIRMPPLYNSAICVCSRLPIISVELLLTSDLRFRLSRHLKFPFPAQSSELDSTELQGGGRNKEVIRYRLGGGMIEEEPTTPDWSRPRPNSPLSSLSLSRLSGLSLASNTYDKLDILEAK